MTKISRVVITETLYIAAAELIFSVLMQAVFLIIGMWNVTLLFANLASGLISVLNFFFMALSVQKIVTLPEKEAKMKMNLSKSVRFLILAAVIAIGVLIVKNPGIPYYVCLLLPLLFPRLAISLRPLIGKYEQQENGDDAENPVQERNDTEE